MTFQSIKRFYGQEQSISARISASLNDSLFYSLLQIAKVFLQISVIAFGIARYLLSTSRSLNLVQY